MASLSIFHGIGAMLLFVVCLMGIVNLSIGDQRYCGDNLRDVLDLMCPVGFNKFKTKRSSLPLDKDLDSEFDDEDFNFGLSLNMLPFLTSEGNSGIAKLRRRRHGVAHECCDKPCTMKEIMSYCKNPAL